jgi:4-aminobutyrate aminotransferase-like enzyme
MKLPKGSLAITGAGHLVGCAAALAAIDYTEKENLSKNAEVVGRVFLKGLQDLMAKHELIGDVRGAGLLIGLELVKNRVSKEPAVEEIVKINRIAYEHGLLSAYDGLRGNVFRIMPSLALREDEAKLAVEIFDNSFSLFEKGYS